jgi:CRP/FNR family transcriptional regulator, cyclic AMP receptor protein
MIRAENGSRDDLAKRDYLSTIEIFQDLTSAEMEHLEQVTAMITCERGRIFYNPEEPAEVLFILKKGEVAISRTTIDGKKLIVETVGAGAIFGEMAILGQRMHQNGAEALTDCLICVMSRLDVEELLLSDPRIAMRLLQCLSSRLARAEERLEEMAFHDVPTRLASLLLRLASNTDWRGRSILSGLTHQQLAELVGTSRETATLTLNTFKADGLIEIARKRVTILDRNGLEAIAASRVPGRSIH